MIPITRHNTPFYLFLAGTFAFLTIPRMAQAGMFLDGTMYAVISRNFASGVGSAWLPRYSAVDMFFREQPPLGFVLQGALFTLFGDHLAVERVYSFVVAAVTALLMIAIWRRTIADRRYDWLPLFFWLVPSALTWAIVNNMLETTQSLLTTAAVLLFVLSVQSASAGMVWAGLAGALVVAAVLTKGPTGLFPLAAPAIGLALFRAHRRAMVRSGVAMALGFVATVALVLSSNAARTGLRGYWEEQLSVSISGTRRSGRGRWESLGRHLAGGIFLRMGALAAIGWLVGRSARKPGDAIDPDARTWRWFFALLALSASLPVALSARISGHYLVPSMPIYALAFAAFTLPLLRTRLDSLRARRALPATMAALGAALLAAAVAIPLAGGVLEARDASWIAEYRRLAPALPRDATLGTCEAARGEFGLHAYMLRFFAISLDVGPEQPREYFLRMTDRGCEAPASCVRVQGTERLEVLRCGG